MATSNLNIRMDKDIKEQADQLFNELGLTMTAAVAVPKAPANVCAI